MAVNKLLIILSLSLFLSSSGMSIPITLTQDYCKTLVETENKKHKNPTLQNNKGDDNAVHYRVRSNANAVPATMDNGLNMKNLQGIGGTMGSTGSNSGLPSLSIQGGSAQAGTAGGQSPFINTSSPTASQSSSSNVNNGSGTINSVTNSTSTSTSNTTTTGFSAGGAGGAGGAGANSPGGNGGASAVQGGIAASNNSNVAANGGVMTGGNSIVSTGSGAAAGAGSVVAGQGGTAVSIQQNGVMNTPPGGYLNFGPANNGTTVTSNGNSPEGIPIMDNSNMRAILATCLDLYYNVER